MILPYGKISMSWREIRNYLLFIFLTSIMGVLNVQRCKDGVLDCATIGQIIDALTNNETYGILKVFSMTLADTTM